MYDRSDLIAHFEMIFDHLSDDQLNVLMEKNIDVELTIRKTGDFLAYLHRYAVARGDISTEKSMRLALGAVKKITSGDE